MSYEDKYGSIIARSKADCVFIQCPLCCETHNIKAFRVSEIRDIELLYKCEKNKQELTTVLHLGKRLQSLSNKTQEDLR